MANLAYFATFYESYLDIHPDIGLFLASSSRRARRSGSRGRW